MIATSVFYDRRDNYCVKCDFWKGVCLKGHKLSSPQGCPVHKFEPVHGADYANDKPAKTAVQVPQPGNCCGNKDPDLVPLSWNDAATKLAASMRTWAASGFVTVDEKKYNQRFDTCLECEHYRWFQCRLCKCVVMVKAKLPEESCPAQKW